MDSNVAEDLLSSPELGSGQLNRDALSPFLNHDPPGQMSRQQSSTGTLVDSSDLSPGTDTSRGRRGFCDASCSSIDERDLGSSSELHRDTNNSTHVRNIFRIDNCSTSDSGDIKMTGSRSGHSSTPNNYLPAIDREDSKILARKAIQKYGRDGGYVKTTESNCTRRSIEDIQDRGGAVQRGYDEISNSGGDSANTSVKGVIESCIDQPWTEGLREIPVHERRVVQRATYITNHLVRSSPCDWSTQAGLTRHVDTEDSARWNSKGSLSSPQLDPTFRRVILRHLQRIDRSAKARCWSRLTAAAAFSAATAANAKRILILEVYTIKLQQQAALRRRELDKKTRALSVLLRDNWANMVLKQEREMCALRIQLAQSEADLEEHIGSIICPASGAERIGAEQEGVNKRKERENAAEVFFGGAEAEVGMVALQGARAHKLRMYLAAKGSHLRRARAEAQQWRSRCEVMESRLHDIFDYFNGRHGQPIQDSLASMLLKMLHEKDRRLSAFYKGLAALAASCSYSRPSKENDNGRRCYSRRKAAEFLLKQMYAAGEEARSHLHRLSLKVRRLETSLANATGAPGRPPEFAMKQSIAYKPRKIERQGEAGGMDLQSNGGIMVEDSPLQVKPPHGDAAILYNAVSDAGVQLATDAHELVSSLRSKVSALESQRAALQSRIDRLEDALAVTINMSTKASGPEKGGGETVAVTIGDSSTEMPDEDAVAPSSASVFLDAWRTGRRGQADRKARAAAILLQALKGKHSQPTRPSLQVSTDATSKPTKPTAGDTNNSDLGIKCRRESDEGIKSMCPGNVRIEEVWGVVRSPTGSGKG